MKKKVIALCGNTENMESYFDAYKKLTGTGYEVLFPSIFHLGENPADYSEMDTIRISLQEVQIEIADRVYIINDGENISEIVKHFVCYAKESGKMVEGISEEEIERIIQNSTSDEGKRTKEDSKKQNVSDVLVNGGDSIEYFESSIGFFAELIQILTLVREKNKILKPNEEYIESKEYKQVVKKIWDWLGEEGFGYFREKLNTKECYYEIRDRLRMEYIKTSEENEISDNDNPLCDLKTKSCDLDRFYLPILQTRITTFKGEKYDNRKYKYLLGELLEELEIETAWFEKPDKTLIVNTAFVDDCLDVNERKEEKVRKWHMKGKGRINVGPPQDKERVYIDEDKHYEYYKELMEVWNNIKKTEKRDGEPQMDYITAMKVVHYLTSLLPIVEFKNEEKDGTFNAAMLSFETYKKRKETIRGNVMKYYHQHRVIPELDRFDAYKEYFYECGMQFSKGAMLNDSNANTVFNDRWFKHSMEILQYNLCNDIRKTIELYNKESGEGIEWDDFGIERRIIVYLQEVKESIDDKYFAEMEKEKNLSEEARIKQEQYFDHICECAYKKASYVEEDID